MRKAKVIKRYVWSHIWGHPILYSTSMLWLLLMVNVAGTAYGYMWYGEQLIETYESMNRILLLFVPDSPTASLFFALSLCFMLAERSAGLWGRLVGQSAFLHVRQLIDALAVITLVKYGVWAVVMNFADGYQGGGIEWKQWMLIISHAGMAVQAVIYAKLMRFSLLSVAAAAVWTLTNDYLDYHLLIHPWLYGPLEDDLNMIEPFTILLSAICVALAIVLYKRTDRKQRL